MSDNIPNQYSPLLARTILEHYRIVPDMEDERYIEFSDVLAVFNEVTGENWDNQTGFVVALHDLGARGLKAIGLRVNLAPKTETAERQEMAAGDSVPVSSSNVTAAETGSGGGSGDGGNSGGKAGVGDGSMTLVAGGKQEEVV